MRSNGYIEYTLNFVSKALGFLGKHADLSDPEVVKNFVGGYNANNGYR